MFQDILILRQHPLCHSRYIIYILIPTSNHNHFGKNAWKEIVVYLLYPTSNHNICLRHLRSPGVVYLLYLTSNHNMPFIG